VARHDDVAEARGRLPPSKNLLFRFPFLYITPCTRKGGIERSLSAQAGRSFFYPKGGKVAKKEKKKELDLVKPSFSLIDENLLKSRIYTIRGVKVMLDADLAEIYGYSTKAFNQQVKNNIERFAEDFRFQLSDAEILLLSRSKFLTSIQVKGVKGGRSYKPYAFTEQGIYMLMTVLKGRHTTALWRC
jgi:hypothetical protein